MGCEEAIILVVGNETESKSCVADALAEGRSASEVGISSEGVRILRRNSSNTPKVIDTVALATYDGWSILDTSRAWIARNCLKGLLGKPICVLCVATSSGPHDDIYKEPDYVNNKFSWLNLLAFTFRDHQRAIMILVKLHGTHASGATKLGMKDVLQRDGFETSNMMVTTLRGGDLNLPIKKALAHSARRQSGEAKSTRSTMVSFCLKEATRDSSIADKLGPWGPERVIVLGRTGSGKSTLAQMLTSGKLDPCSEDFASSSGIRGQTKEVSHGEGRGWYVVDTPGFGEPKDEGNTINTKEAESKIKRYVQLIEGTYTHFIHVVMKDRIDWMEERLWQFFLQLFGEDIKENFTVVISNADKTWVEKNMDALQKSFKGCESFLGAEFPPITKDDAEWEAELEEVRAESLKALEEGLTVLFRTHTYCDFGQFSKMNIKRERSGLDTATRDTRSWRKKTTLSLRASAMERYSDFRRLALMLNEDDEPVLDLKI